MVNTTANFTAAAQTRNIEAGVIIRNPAIVDRLVRYFDGVVTGGQPNPWLALVTDDASGFPPGMAESGGFLPTDNSPAFPSLPMPPHHTSALTQSALHPRNRHRLLSRRKFSSRTIMASNIGRHRGRMSGPGAR
jgi:phosphatidylserine/phosphatidylglycerophosphate/cardiolipin synthase-like enzyme